MSFSLENDYGWLTIDADTGAVSAVSTTLVSGRFPVVIIENNAGVITNHNVAVEVYHPNNTTVLNNDLTTQFGGVEVPVQPRQGNVMYTTYRCPSSPTSDDWHYLLPYQPRYNADTLEMVVIDTALAVSSIITKNPDGYSWNGNPNVITDEGKLAIQAYDYTDGGKALHIYDPALKTLTYDTIPIASANFTGEGAAIALAPFNHPTTGNRVIYMTSGAGVQTYIGYYDTELSAFTEIGAIGAAATDRLALEIASDATYIYQVHGRQPTVRLYQHAIVGGVQTLIAETADNTGDINLTQRRWGVLANFTGVVGYTDGNYWIYNNTITAATDLDTPPYPLNDGVADFTGPETYLRGAYDGGPDLSDAFPDNNGACSVTYTGRTSGLLETYNFTVLAYTLEMQALIAYEGNKILSGSTGYGGLSKIDSVLNTNETSLTYTASRIVFTEADDGKIIGSGYPSQSIFVTDPAQAPDVGTSLLGYLTTDSFGHYSHGICHHNGITYVTGIQHRIGDSGTIGWFNHLDYANTVGGFSDETDARLLEYGLKNPVVVNNGLWLAVSSYIETGSLETFAKIFIFEISSKTFIKTIDISDTFTTAGQIIAVNENEIVGVTRLPDQTMVMYKVNVITNAVVWLETVTGAKILQAEVGPASVDYTVGMTSDTNYVYANATDIDSNGIMCRINHSIGGVEFLGLSTISPFDIADDNTVYKFNALERIEKKTAVEAIENMPMKALSVGAEMVTSPSFLSATGWNVNAAFTLDTVLGTLELTVATNGITTTQYNVTPVIGDTFYLTVEIETTNGINFALTWGGVTTFFNSVGTHIIEIVPTSTNATVSIATNYSGAVFKLGGVSIKPVTNLLA